MKNSIQHLFFPIVIFLTSWNMLFAQIDKDIKMYTQTWDEIINHGKLELFNDTNFDKDISLIMIPENVVGLANVKDFYTQYVTGFSNIEFTIVDIFGQNENIVKHWRFKGIHTGEFFGIPATGKAVSLEGVTLVKMKNGKIIREQDFMDNMVFLQQLGLASASENRSIIDNLYKAFAAGDIPAVLGGMDANIIWNEAEGNSYADGNPYIGPEAVLNGVFARVGGDHEYFTLNDIQLHEMSDNKILATLRYDAKRKETGKSYNAQVAHLWALKDGKIISFQQYVDTKKLNDAMSK